MFERVLIVETSGKIGQVAVAAEGHILAERSLPEARRHARDLTARCAELLAEQEWHPRDLTAVIADIGPGSFTGLRVGLASAKALAYATNCMLLGVPAFDAIAAEVPECPENLEIIADALQGQVYCQRFERRNGAWQAIAPLAIRPFEEWLAGIVAGSPIAGPGVANFRERLPASSVVADEPDVAGLLHVAQADPTRFQVSPWVIEPIYLRGSSAEEKRKSQEALRRPP